MKRKVCSLLLCFILLIAQFPAVKVSADSRGVCGSDLVWRLSDDGVLTISGSGTMNTYSRKGEAPWGKDITSLKVAEGVTDIGAYAFYDCQKLTSVEFPSSLTTINASAFEHCIGIRDLQIPEGVQDMDNACFANCSGVEHLKLPETLSRVGFAVFYGCDQLRSVQIPSGLGVINYGMFGECTNLNDLQFGEGVCWIRASAFDGCSNLTTLTIPASVSSVEDNAFGRCSGLENIVVTEGNKKYVSGDAYSALINNEGKLILGCKNTIVPDKVTTIGKGAFFEMDQLTSIELPDSVTTIEDYAFDGCTGLTRIKIPSSVTSIAKDVFKDCSPDLYIIAKKDSAAYVYAKLNDIHTVESEDQIPNDPSPTETVSPTETPETSPIVQPTENPILVPTETPAVGVTSQPGADATAKPSAQPSANPVPTAIAGTKTVPEVKLSAPKSLSSGEKKKAVVTTSSAGAQTWTSSNEKVLKVSADGTLNPVGCGSAEITIRVAETASCQAGTASVTVKVIPAKIKGLKVKAVGSGLLRVTWKKQKIKGAFCEIQISKGKAFGIVQTAKPYPKLQKGKFLGRGLKRGQTIYVRMRVKQKDVTGKKVRGKWSAVKKVKIK